MKILSFPASNSRYSINRQLLNYAERFLTGFEIQRLDINDFEMPIYSEDREHAFGIPEQATAFVRNIASVDALLISFAEHNGNYTAAFKNIIDWCSRLDRNIYQGKRMLLLSTSPGPGGGSSVWQWRRMRRRSLEEQLWLHCRSLTSMTALTARKANW